MQTKQEF